MNEYDTEIIRSILRRDLFELTSNLDEARIVLLNTCSVREHAARRVKARVHEIKRAKNGQPVRIGILGCMATNLGEDLLNDKKLPIRFIMGPDSYKRLPEMIRKVDEDGEKAYDLELSTFETYSDVYPKRESGVNAWIAVMRGCDNFCSFCVVPYARGRERSRSPESVLDEVRQLTREGFSQVTLLGQNVNSYRYDEKDFAFLLDQVSKVPGIERVRFTSPHPKDFPHRLLEVMAENPRICKHIHLPMQAGSDRILDLMRRTYSKQQYMDLTAKIRETIPDIVLTTDIIVGFPTESDEEYADTLDVVKKVGFHSSFIFKYSERKGTIAVKKYKDDVPETVKTERIVHLNALQKEISLRRNREQIGLIQEILIERENTKKSDKDYQGRNDGNILVIIPKGEYGCGDFLNVKIIDATAHVLKGEVLEK